MKPELLAVRAINQYRSRDVLAYLGLRYYLDNDCAKKDLWARSISEYLVKTRELPVYFCSYHFKEMTTENTVISRNIYLPGPNEILAETALLHDCSTQSAFQSLDCVYSYHFPNPSSKEGVFKAYFPGFQKRNSSISEVCKDLSDTDTIVRYTDIKKFYPNISHELAFQAWVETCDSSNISNTSRELGENLLIQYNKVSKSNKQDIGVLTGPMFSHLVANLVLAKVDRLMRQYTQGKYWRYVDDFVLVGSSEQVEKNRSLLNSILGEMGFSLHDEHKDFEVEAATWLENTNNLDASKSKIWTNLIANIKRFLIANPDQKDELKEAFLQAEINIPLIDYSNAVIESSYREKFFDWLIKYPWAPNSVRSLTVDRLVRDALKAREVYCQEINSLLSEDLSFTGYKKKQFISKLRFFSMRLSYLATLTDLLSIRSASQFCKTHVENCLLR